MFDKPQGCLSAAGISKLILLLILLLLQVQNAQTDVSDLNKACLSKSFASTFESTTLAQELHYPWTQETHIGYGISLRNAYVD